MGRGENLEQLIEAQRGRIAPNVTPSVSPVSELLTEIDWHYLVELDYEDHLDLEAHQYCDSICRCRKISHARVISSGMRDEDHLEEIGRFYTGGYKTKFYKTMPPTRWQMLDGDPQQRVREIYAAERVLSRITPDADDFEISIVGGYYGQEIGSVSLDSSSAWCQELNKLNADDDSALVEGVLKMEYGTLLPQLEGKAWRREIISLSQISYGNPNRADMSAEAIEGYAGRFNPDSYWNKWMSKNRLSKRDRVERGVSAAEIPQGVGVLNRSSGKVRLIDGYHRIAAANAASKQAGSLQEIALWVCDS